MADFYTWNCEHEHDRSAIVTFLCLAEARAAGGAPIPVRANEALATISWLRGLLDRKPSEMRNAYSAEETQ